MDNFSKRAYLGTFYRDRLRPFLQTNLISNSRPKSHPTTMLLTFAIFGWARNHGKKFPSQTSFSRIILDVRKAYNTVWIDGLMEKLFTEFGIRGRMWLVVKNLYNVVKAQVLYSGSLSRGFGISQGTGQGRTLAPFIRVATDLENLEKSGNLKET